MGDFGHWVDIKKTKKPFRCIFCCRKIPTGNQSHGFDGKWEGDWQNWRCCDRCYHVIYPTTENGEEIGDGDFDAWLDDYRACDKGCKPDRWYGGTCDSKWSEDKQSIVITCSKCGDVRTIPYGYNYE